MTASAAAHDAHLDAEQAEGDRREELAQREDRWAPDLVDLAALDPPASPEDEETYPLDPERTAA